MCKQSTCSVVVYNTTTLLQGSTWISLDMVRGLTLLCRTYSSEGFHVDCVPERHVGAAGPCTATCTGAHAATCPPLVPPGCSSGER